MKKVKLDREIFVEKLGKLMKFIPSSAVVPAFENVAIKISSTGKMEMMGSDGSVQCRMLCDAKSADDFGICVPASILFKTVSLFRENEVVIKQKDEKKIEISSGKSKFNIALDCFINEYPVMSMESSDNEIAIRQFFLKLALKSSAKFVDDENANANYTAINIQEVDNKIVATGLNGAIMCRVSVAPISINKWDPVNILTDTSSKVTSLLDEKGEVSVIHNNGKISFFTSMDLHESFEVISVTANIKFPPSEKLFNNKPENIFEANTIELCDAIKRLKLYSEPGIPPEFDIEVNEVDTRLTSLDKMTDRDGEEFVSIMNSNTLGIKKTFNSNFMIQILNSIESNDVVVNLSSEPNRPSFIYPKVSTKEEEMFCFLITSINRV